MTEATGGGATRDAERPSVPPSESQLPARARTEPPPHEDSVSAIALDHLLEGCQIVDREYRYLYLNEAVARQGKVDARRVLGLRMQDVYPGIEHTELFGVLRRCLEQGLPGRMLTPFSFPDGSQGWFELRFEPHPRGATILSIDVTERVQNELALERSLRALNTLSRCNKALVHADDEQGFLRDVCNLVVSTAGHRLAWIGLLDRKHPTRIRVAARAGRDDGYANQVGVDLSDPERAAGPMGRCLTSGVSEHTRSVALDPTFAPWREEALARGFASALAIPIKDHGEAIGALAVYSSVEDAFDEAETRLLEEVALDVGYGLQALRHRETQERALAELAEERSRTRAIYDHLPHPAFVFGPGPAGFRLLDFNRAADALTRGQLAGRIGEPARLFEGEIPEISRDLYRCVSTRQAVQRETVCRLPGPADPIHMVLSYGVLSPNLVLLHAQDITEQRLTEERLAASQRLEAVGRLAGGIAHDFNNLLSVVLAYAELALQELGPTHSISADLAQIREAGERAAALTRQLLAFSRKQILEPRKLDLNEVVSGVEPMLRRLLGEDIDILVHRGADLGTVTADPGQIEQVLVNLAVNSRDAMPRGGKLTIETAHVELDAIYAEQHTNVTPGAYVRLSVTDTGVGMDSHTRNHAFEPFFSTKYKGKGTGLGLATVYGIVRQSGGHVWVYSEPGRGATFKVYLPRVDAPPDERKRNSPPSVQRGTETLLVVEDEAAVRCVAERILSGAGYRVLCAADAQEALRIAEVHGPEIALLLTDVVMPGMGGTELASRLGARYPNLKVLFASGYTDNALMHQGALEPGTLFVAKPFTIADLTSRVRAALDGPRRS